MKHLLALALVVFSFAVHAQDCKQLEAEVIFYPQSIVDEEDFCWVTPKFFVSIRNHYFCPITDPIKTIMVSKTARFDGPNCGLSLNGQVDGYLIQSSHGAFMSLE